jgi:hypothetical protein
MKFLVAILLLLPIISFADYSEESYFLTGKFYGSDGRPLCNKEILLVTGNRYFCFFATDKYGNYKVEVPYLVPCLRGRNRLDDLMAGQAKEYNSDTIKFYFDNLFASVPNLWYDYYSKDTLCKRDYCYHGPEKQTQCLTKKADVFLHQNSDTINVQMEFREKIKADAAKINQACLLPQDSVHVLKQYDSSRKVYNMNFNKQYDSLSRIGKETDLIYRRYEELHPLSDSMSLIRIEISELEGAIGQFFGRYQLLNRKVESLKEPVGFCDRLFKLEFDAKKNEYRMRSDLFLNNYFVLKVNREGIITDFYDYSLSEVFR